MTLGCFLNSWYVLFNVVKEKSGSRFVGSGLCLWWMTQITEMCNKLQRNRSKQKCSDIIFGRFCVLENIKPINRQIKMHQTVITIKFIQTKNKSELSYSTLIITCGTDNFLEYPLNPWYFHERLEHGYGMGKSQVLAFYMQQKRPIFYSSTCCICPRGGLSFITLFCWLYTSFQLCSFALWNIVQMQN